MKFISWNIDSLNAALTGSSDRALLTREVLNKISLENADFVAIQETKLPEAGMNGKQQDALKEIFPDYSYAYVSSAPPARKGYAGTMIMYKKFYGDFCGSLNQQTDRIVSPDKSARDSVSSGKGLVSIASPAINAPDTMDDEGRIVTVETDSFYFTTVYTPNAGDGLKRLGDRQEWDRRYRDYLSGLDKSKPVIACGDYNCAHEEIDLKNPKDNHFSAGFTDEERAGFSEILSAGFTDTFRLLNPDREGAYSWWAQRIKTSKINNSGWRIDYFLVSDRLKDKIISSEMMDSGARQDHCPLILEVEI